MVTPKNYALEVKDLKKTNPKPMVNIK